MTPFDFMEKLYRS